MLMATLVLAGIACHDTVTPPSDTTPSHDEARSTVERQLDPDVDNEQIYQLTSDNRDFAFELYQAIRTEEGNLFYSPHSISIALAMTLLGADGQTAYQMHDVLDFSMYDDDLHNAFNYLDLELASRDELPEDPDDTRPGFALNIANATWGQVGYHFESAFLDGLALNYGAGMQLVDFEAEPEGARELINAWIEEQTEDKIKDMLPSGSITSATQLVLANAIYFLANWEFQFDELLTRDADFHLLDGTVVSVPTMSLTEELPYMAGDGYQAVELPYHGGDLSMVIVLPDEGELENFESGLTGDKVADILSELDTNRVALELPRWESESTLQLREILQQMGMTDAFDPNNANFFGMTGTTDLFISQVLHRAVISVDEEGTEAAAATVVVMVGGIAPTDLIELDINRPFIYMIRDIPTDAILFVGRTVDPS